LALEAKTGIGVGDPLEIASSTSKLTETGGIFVANAAT